MRDIIITICIVIAIMVVSLKFGPVIAYKFLYEDQVRATVLDMVKIEAIK